jgi:hypothetical protein
MDGSVPADGHFAQPSALTRARALSAITLRGLTTPMPSTDLTTTVGPSPRGKPDAGTPARRRPTRRVLCSSGAGPASRPPRPPPEGRLAQ